MTDRAFENISDFNLIRTSAARVRGRVVSFERVENPRTPPGFSLALLWFVRVIFSNVAITIAVYGGLLVLAYYLIVDIRFPQLSDTLFGAIAFGIMSLFQAIFMFLIAGPFGPLPLIVLIVFVWFGGMRNPGRGGDMVSSVFMHLIMVPVRITMFVVRTVARLLIRTVPRFVRHLQALVDVWLAQPLLRAIQHPRRDMTHELVVEYGAAAGLARLAALSLTAREDDGRNRPVNWEVTDRGDPMDPRLDRISARIAGTMVGAPIAVDDRVVLYGTMQRNGVIAVETGQNLTTNGVIQARPNPRF